MSLWLVPRRGIYFSLPLSSSRVHLCCYVQLLCTIIFQTADIKFSGNENFRIGYDLNANNVIWIISKLNVPKPPALRIPRA